jgi:hypothetical protein
MREGGSLTSIDGKNVHRDIGSKRGNHLKEIEMDYMAYVIFGLVAMVVIDAIILGSSYNYLHKHGG